MKKLLPFICLSFTLSLLCAQTPQSPMYHDHPFCGYQDDSKADDWDEIGSRTMYNCDCMTTKTVNVRAHVIDTIGGGKNFPPGIGTPFINQSFSIANQKLANNQPASHPGIPGQANPDINIQFNLLSIQYHETQNWCNGATSISFPASQPNTIDVYFVENCYEWYTGSCCRTPTNCFACWGGLYSGGTSFQVQRNYYRLINNTNFCSNPRERAADIIIHEFGHVLGQRHSFQSDFCNDTYDPGHYNTNNFMDWNPCTKGSLTCCQVERFHNRLNTNPAYVTIAPLVPQPSSMSGPNVATCGAYYSIASVPGATSYTWTWQGGCGNVSASGGTYGYLYSNCNFSTGGLLCVTAHNSCGSSQPRCRTLSLNGCGGYPSNPTQEEVVAVEFLPDAPNVYPNPAVNTIQVSYSKMEEGVKARLYALSGQQVKEYAMQSSSDFSLDISDVPSGIYLLNLQTSQEVYSKKIVVKK